MNKHDKHDELVASLGCALCQLKEGKHPPEQEVALYRLLPSITNSVIALCPPHFNGAHGVQSVSSRTFAKHHGVSQHDLLIWTREQLK